MSGRPTAGVEEEAFARGLGLGDFTLLVIGAIVGDGIYVLAAMGAASLGPAQLVAWLVAGVLAGFIILAFIQCAAIHPQVGGSYSYARHAFGPFVGFLAGWSLLAGEWVALSAFPQAFFNYFHALTGAPESASLLVKLALVGLVTGVNLVGVRQSATTNDALTVAKLLPLGVLVVLAGLFALRHPSAASGHLHPFAPLGMGQLGSAVLPIFWAYAGFELAVLPAGEVRTPGRTLPRGLGIGLAIATGFYLLSTLAVVIAAPWEMTATSTHPVANAMEGVLAALGGPASAGFRFVSLGALVSIGGVFVVFMLGLSRLTYALAQDGLLPSMFGRLHGRYRTPWANLLVQAVWALVFSTLFDLRSLLSTAVLFLSITYLLTALSAMRLVRRHPEQRLHLPAVQIWLSLAAAASVYLAAQGSPRQMAVAGGVLGGGCVLYLVRRRRPGMAVAPPGGMTVRAHHEPHGWLWRSWRRSRRPRADSRG